MQPCIIGWSHTRFGRLAAETAESLIVSAGWAALDHAGIDGAHVDELYVGTFNPGFVQEDFIFLALAQRHPVVALKVGHED